MQKVPAQLYETVLCFGKKYKFDISFVFKLKAINYKQKTFTKFTQKVLVSNVLNLRSLQN